MKHGSTGRNASAFILLILALGPNHGLGIFHKMDKIVPGHRLDTAVIYRVLKNLELEGFTKSVWMDSETGPKKKVYKITATGKSELALYNEDIKECTKRFRTFLGIYSKL